MKRIVLSLIAVMFAFNYAVAGGVKTQQGDKKFFKTATGTAVLDIQFDKAKYDNKMDLSEKFPDIDGLKKIAISGFTETFNEKSKGIQIVKDESAKYIFRFDVTNMDQYWKTFGVIVPGFSTKTWGTFKVIDKSTNEEVLVVNVDEVDGGANPDPRETISDSFEEVAKLLFKLK